MVDLKRKYLSRLPRFAVSYARLMSLFGSLVFQARYIVMPQIHLRHIMFRFLIS